MNLPEKIEAIIRAWPQWSRHEQERMDGIVEEIMDHLRNGTGNGFIRSWCDRVIAPKMPGLVLAEFKAISRPLNTLKVN